MLKKHMAACLVATAFAAAPALAQTTPAPSAGTDRPVASGTGSATSGSPAMQPSPSSGSTASPAPTATTGTAGSPPQTAASGGGTQGQFMTQMQPGHIMA